MATPKVLYLHGFEEDDASPKPQALITDAKLVTTVPALNIYLTKPNSPLVSLLAAPLFLMAAVGSVAAAVAMRQLTGGGWALGGAAGLVCFLVVGYVNRSALLAQAVGISYDKSVAVARAALRKCEPDVVVGFSWGGAIAIELARSGEWNGPTVLLAPAHKKLDQLMG